MFKGPCLKNVTIESVGGTVIAFNEEITKEPQRCPISTNYTAGVRCSTKCIMCCTAKGTIQNKWVEFVYCGYLDKPIAIIVKPSEDTAKEPPQ